MDKEERKAFEEWFNKNRWPMGVSYWDAWKAVVTWTREHADGKITELEGKNESLIKTIEEWREISSKQETALSNSQEDAARLRDCLFAAADEMARRGIEIDQLKARIKELESHQDQRIFTGCLGKDGKGPCNGWVAYKEGLILKQLEQQSISTGKNFCSWCGSPLWRVQVS